MGFRKMLVVISIIIVSMFGLMLTTSYAWYSYENGSTTFNALTTAGEISVSYQNGEYISTDTAVPLSSNEVDRYSDKNNFNIKVNNNKDKKDVMVSVSLVDVFIQDTLKNSNFVIDLYYQGTKKSTVTGNAIVSETDIPFGNVLLDNDTSNQFEIRVYILDNGEVQNNMMTNTFSAKIKVDVVSRLKPAITNYDNPDIYVSGITIDGVSSDSLPVDGYYNMVAGCTKDSVLSWDALSKTITYASGSKVNDVCTLTFTSNSNYPLLNTMPVGSYVKYVGKGGTVGDKQVNCQVNGSASSPTHTAETESPNSCLGENAREDLDKSGYTYGYCFNSSYKYYTTGWRIAYIDSNNKPVIVSAGSPECNTRDSSENENKVYIKTANSLALKYCNSDLADGDCSCLDSDSDGYCDCTDSDSDGLCDEIENNEVDAWAISDIDFYNMTKAISGVGKRLYSSSSSLGDSGGTLGTTLYCGGYFSREECGYNNNLIDNGGYYWFSARYSSSLTNGMCWYPNYRYVSGNSTANAYGLRPVISLSSSVKVTGGSGTMDDPYTISK